MDKSGGYRSIKIGRDACSNFFFNGYKIYSDIVKVKEGSRVQKASGLHSKQGQKGKKKKLLHSHQDQNLRETQENLSFTFLSPTYNNIASKILYPTIDLRDFMFIKILPLDSGTHKEEVSSYTEHGPHIIGKDWEIAERW